MTINLKTIEIPVAVRLRKTVLPQTKLATGYSDTVEGDRFQQALVDAFQRRLIERDSKSA